jgi:hypothetical protein
MTKPPRVLVLRTSSGEGAFARLCPLLDRELGLKCEPFTLKAAKNLPNPESAWYVVLLTPDLKGLTQELNWVMNHTTPTGPSRSGSNRATRATSILGSTS